MSNIFESMFVVKCSTNMIIANNWSIYKNLLAIKMILIAKTLSSNQISFDNLS